MDVELWRALMSAVFASSVAVLLVAVLRRPLRAVIGARATYWLWLLVPALVLASLLPAPSQVLQIPSESLTGQVRSALAAVVVNTGVPRGPAGLTTAMLAIWAAGACVMFVLLLRRQRSFSRSLGTLQPDADGFQRGAVVAPMLVGAWHPRIVVPLDFESRYSEQERELVLAHERAHLVRRDVAINAIASGWLCLFWFNPLIYWAMGWLRTDQELACDALVLAQRADARRCYANALLKTQLATESGWRMPVGCHWQSNDSLKERIAMLKRPLPGMSRQLIGIALVLGLTVSAGYAAWAGQPVEAKGPRILVDVKVRVTNTQTNEVFAVATRYLVHSGELPEDMKVPPAAFTCIPFTSGEVEKSSAWATVKAQGINIMPGQIFQHCIIRQDGAVIENMAFLTMDGEPASFERTDREKIHHYRIELNATTSEERIAAAGKPAGDR
jgi:beta-lactamase regulating signal transducer with metallopeptidase domain